MKTIVRSFQNSNSAWMKLFKSCLQISEKGLSIIAYGMVKLFKIVNGERDGK